MQQVQHNQNAQYKQAVATATMQPGYPQYQQHLQQQHQQYPAVQSTTTTVREGSAQPTYHQQVTVREGSGQPTYQQQVYQQTTHSQGYPQHYQQQAQYHQHQQFLQQHQQYPQTTTTTHPGGYTKASSETVTQYRGAETTTETTLHQHERIIGERIVEHEVRVPKKVIREDVIEKIIIVPEKVVHEEIVEEVARVREKIVEIAKPIIQEKIVEVPEIEYVEKIVEICEKVVQERIKEVPRIEIQERIIEIPKVVVQEKIIEVPEIEYREIPIEKIVEVPEIQEQVVTRTVPVPQYVDKPEAHYVTVEVPEFHERNIPVPVEAVSTFEYKLPRVRPVCKRASFPLYVPKFVEVIVPEEMMDSVLKSQTERLTQQVSLLTSQAAPSLCEIENVAAEIHRSDFQKALTSDYHAAIANAWGMGLVGQASNVVVRGAQANPTASYTARSAGNQPVQEYVSQSVGQGHRHEKEDSQKRREKRHYRRAHRPSSRKDH